MPDTPAEPDIESIFGDFFPSSTGPVSDESSAWLCPQSDTDSNVADADPPSKLDIARDAEAAIQTARSYTESLLAALKDWWSRSPESIRPMMMVAAVVGMLAGLLFGTLAPSFSSTIVSAFGGALLWLAALRIVLAQTGDAIASRLPESVTALLIIWMVVSLLGVVIQWTFRPKPADKPG